MKGVRRRRTTCRCSALEAGGQRALTKDCVTTHGFLKFLQCFQTFTEVTKPQIRSMPKHTAQPIL